MPGDSTGQRDDLTRYVVEYLRETGASVRELARRATDPESGIRPSHGWLQAIVNGEMDRAPDIRRLRGLAAAMGDSVDKLARLAGAQFLGLQQGTEVTVDDDRGVWVPAENLSREDRERLRAMASDIARHMQS